MVFVVLVVRVGAIAAYDNAVMRLILPSNDNSTVMA